MNDRFEYRGTKLYHFQGETLRAVVEAEHVRGYKLFVSEAPEFELPPEGMVIPPEAPIPSTQDEIEAEKLSLIERLAKLGGLH